MKRLFYNILFLLWASFSIVWADPDPEEKIPPAKNVQHAVWEQMEFKDFKLEGVMKTAKNTYPIVLKTKHREMIFEFQDRDLQIRVELIPTGSIVHKRKKFGEPWMKLSGKQKTETILDSDIAYEDLGVDFLRWENVKPLGADSIKTLDAWAYQARPSGVSRYAKADYWISSDYLAVLRVDAYNSKDQVVKRVEVNGVQKVPNTNLYVIKEMMIASIIPGRDLSKSKTFIEIYEAKPGSGIPD
ncbi:MAG: outer membrane lipoprotein-sorting protein [Verrucomicrobiota bacterium]